MSDYDDEDDEDVDIGLQPLPSRKISWVDVPIALFDAIVAFFEQLSMSLKCHYNFRADEQASKGRQETNVMALVSEP